MVRTILSMEITQATPTDEILKAFPLSGKWSHTLNQQSSKGEEGLGKEGDHFLHLWHNFPETACEKTICSLLAMVKIQVALDGWITPFKNISTN